MSTTLGTVTVGAGDLTVIDLALLATYDVSNGGVLIVPSGLATAAVGTTINLQGGGTLEVGTSLATLGLLNSLQLTGTNNELLFTSAGLLNGLDLSGTGFGTTDSLALTGADSITGQTYDPSTGQLALSTSSGIAVVTLPEGLDPTDFAITQTSGASVLTYTACFGRGTRIDTPTGAVAVEDLVPGNLVTLAHGGSAAVVWIGHRTMRPSMAEDPTSIAPVRVAEGALGDGLPRRPLRLSPDHALFLDGVLVPARLLVNGTTIASEIVDKVEYFHVELDRHDVILAEGVPAETYIDTGNRAMFANAPITDMRPAMDGSMAAEPALLCAPMVLGGDRLDAIRAELADRTDAARTKRRASAA